MEINIVECLLALNAAGWGVAWIMFRKQFGDVGAKVDAMSEKMGALSERLARLEGQHQVMSTGRQ